MLLQRPRSLHREAKYSGDLVTQHLLSSYMIQATQECQVLKVLRSVQKNILVVHSHGASERISLKESKELSICHFHFDIQVPFVWLGLIQEFNIHFSPSAQHDE